MKRDDTAAVYHELSQKYGQFLTVAQVSQEMQIKSRRTIRERIPDGWVGKGAGLRIKTISFARQLVELSEHIA